MASEQPTNTDVPQPENVETLPGKKSLSPRQERVAQLIATGTSIAAAAREVKIADCTIYMWRKQHPEFSQRIEQLKRDLFEQTIGRLSSLMSKEVIDALTKLVTESPSEPMRLEASKAVADILLNAKNHTDLKDQIDALVAARTQ